MNVRIGIIGIGGTISSTTRILAGEESSEVVALADPDPARRDRVLEGINDVQIFDDYLEMLDAVDLDAVCIGLPTWLHAPASQAALERGLHVLCEKPPTNNAEEMVKLAQLAEEKKLVCMFVRQSRFSPRLMAGRQRIQGGELGDIYYADTRWIRTRWCSGRGWRHDKEKGGGGLLDLGIHAIDNAWFMMGCPQPTEVSAELYCHFSGLAAADQIYTADDAACGQVRFKNGSVLHFAVAFSLNTANEETPDEENIVRTEFQDVKIYGTLGGIENDRLLIGTPNGVEIKLLNTAELSADPITLQSQEFIRAIIEKDQPLNPAAEAVMLMQMLDSAMESSQTGKAVPIT